MKSKVKKQNGVRKIDYIIHTDGSYSMKRGVGAFAYVICDREDREIKRRVWKISNETSNRAELKAIIAALHNLPDGAIRVRVESDSIYALNTLFNGWRRNVNTDLFDVFERIMNERGFRVTPVWVKGHNGNPFNEICDKMCREATAPMLSQKKRS